MVVVNSRMSKYSTMMDMSGMIVQLMFAAHLKSENLSCWSSTLEPHSTPLCFSSHPQT